MVSAQTHPVIVMGGGGHARVLLDLLSLIGAKVLGVTTFDGKGEPPLPDIAILGNDDVILNHSPTDVALVNAVGYARASDLRKEIQEKFLLRGYRFSTLIHPAAVTSSFANLEDGCQIMAGAVVQAKVKVGIGAIINTRASVDHDCVIGAYAHIAPGATLSGNVHVGECSLIGVGASVIQGIRIGAMCTIGAGSAVIRNLPDNVSVGGVPARVLK